MTSTFRILVAVAALLAAPLLFAQASQTSITKELAKLRSLSPTERPRATIKLAADIGSLPAGKPKLELADDLAHLVTEGDQGNDARQAVADTLSQALAQSPLPEKKGKPAMPYFDLARLVRYEHVNATLADPQFAQAAKTLVNDDAEIEKADFTLKDLKGKKYTLSALRGKIVVVNFWATWCPPCRLEMPDLDLIYTHFQNQGLVVLSITDEIPFKVNTFIGSSGYHPPVLIDTDGKVHKLFHVESIPRTFVFNRQGKLVGEAIDQCTQRQFLQMLSNTDLHS